MTVYFVLRFDLNENDVDDERQHLRKHQTFTQISHMYAYRAANKRDERLGLSLSFSHCVTMAYIFGVFDPNPIYLCSARAIWAISIDFVL